MLQVVIPSERPPGQSEEDMAKESEFDWQQAIKELHNSQLKASQELEEIAEREKQEMDNRVKQMEEMYEVLNVPLMRRAGVITLALTLQQDAPGKGSR
jgi:hypothetical protein